MINKLFLFVSLCCSSIILHLTTKEHIVEIAYFENNTPVFLEYNPDDFKLESNIRWVLKLNDRTIDFSNPSILNESTRGWFLQYQFQTHNGAGIYKEMLKIRDGKLVIAENRNATMAIATNCRDVAFTNTDNHCECINKIDSSKVSPTTHRLFSSSN